MFWPRVDREAADGHWLWTGEAAGPYGIVAREADEDGRTHIVMAHVYAWMLEHGREPRDGFEIDHVCRVRRCVRTTQDEWGHWHLEEVTHRVNVLRGNGPTAINWRKTQCVNRHPLPPPKAGYWRVCVECRRKRRREYNQRVRDAKRLSEGVAPAGGRLDPASSDPAGRPDAAAGRPRQRRAGGTRIEW